MLMCAFFFFRTSYRLIIQTARPQLICRLLLSRRALRARAISLQHTQLFSAHTVTTIDVLLVTMEDCILARFAMRPANKVAPTLTTRVSDLSSTSRDWSLLQACQVSVF